MDYIDPTLLGKKGPREALRTPDEPLKGHEGEVARHVSKTISPEPVGLISPGNIDLSQRAQLKNPQELSTAGGDIFDQLKSGTVGHLQGAGNLEGGDIFEQLKSGSVEAQETPAEISSDVSVGGTLKSIASGLASGVTAGLSDMIIGKHEPQNVTEYYAELGANLVGSIAGLTAGEYVAAKGLTFLAPRVAGPIAKALSPAMAGELAPKIVKGLTSLPAKAGAGFGLYEGIRSRGDLETIGIATLTGAAAGTVAPYLPVVRSMLNKPGENIIKLMEEHGLNRFQAEMLAAGKAPEMVAKLAGVTALKGIKETPEAVRAPAIAGEWPPIYGEFPPELGKTAETWVVPGKAPPPAKPVMKGPQPQGFVPGFTHQPTGEFPFNPEMFRVAPDTPVTTTTNAAEAFADLENLAIHQPYISAFTQVDRIVRPSKRGRFGGRALEDLFDDNAQLKPWAVRKYPGLARAFDVFPTREVVLSRAEAIKTSLPEIGTAEFELLSPRLKEAIEAARDPFVVVRESIQAGVPIDKAYKRAFFDLLEREMTSPAKVEDRVRVRDAIESAGATKAEKLKRGKSKILRAPDLAVEKATQAARQAASVITRSEAKLGSSATPVSDIADKTGVPWDVADSIWSGLEARLRATTQPVDPNNTKLIEAIEKQYKLAKETPMSGLMSQMIKEGLVDEKVLADYLQREAAGAGVAVEPTAVKKLASKGEKAPAAKPVEFPKGKIPSPEELVAQETLAKALQESGKTIEDFIKAGLAEKYAGMIRLSPEGFRMLAYLNPEWRIPYTQKVWSGRKIKGLTDSGLPRIDVNSIEGRRALAQIRGRGASKNPLSQAAVETFTGESIEKSLARGHVSQVRKGYTFTPKGAEFVSRVKAGGIVQELDKLANRRFEIIRGETGEITGFEGGLRGQELSTIVPELKGDLADEAVQDLTEAAITRALSEHRVLQKAAADQFEQAWQYRGCPPKGK